MNTRTKARKLVEHLKRLNGFAIADNRGHHRRHMGAIIVNAILQAGTTYATVVRPRVVRVTKEYPSARTTSGFKHILLLEGAKNVLQWKDNVKPARVIALTEFLIAEKLETASDLADWLKNDENRPKLLSVNGVGPKTADYLKILVGLPTAAADRWVYKLLAEAGIGYTGYDGARDILNLAADQMGVNRSLFDNSIWRFMSQRDKNASARPK